jgi:hypothetical protein
MAATAPNWERLLLQRLAETEQRYRQAHDAQTTAEYLKALRAFADLVLDSQSGSGLGAPQYEPLSRVSGNARGATCGTGYMRNWVALRHR